MTRSVFMFAIAAMCAVLTGCATAPAHRQQQMPQGVGQSPQSPVIVNGQIVGGVSPQMRQQQVVPSVAPQGVAPAQPMQVTTVPQQRPGTVSEETARAMLEARVMPRSATTDGKTPPPMRSLADTKADKNCILTTSPGGKTNMYCLRSPKVSQ